MSWSARLEDHLERICGLSREPTNITPGHVPSTLLPVSTGESQLSRRGPLICHVLINRPLLSINAFDDPIVDGSK
jgi:hypothetical protein